MARSFIVLLMLVVVFLTGMLLGMDRGSPVLEQDRQEHVQYEQDRIAESEQIPEAAQTEAEIEFTEVYADENEESAHLSQKAASLLEAGVSGFYNLVVNMLYQLSSLFF